MGPNCIDLRKRGCFKKKVSKWEEVTQASADVTETRAAVTQVKCGSVNGAASSIFGAALKM